MTIIEQITQMKNQGTTEQEIINNLQQQGVSPQEINDAISRSQIKSAVAGTEDMQQSNMPSYNPPSPPQGAYTPQTQEINQQEYAPQEEIPQAQEYYPQETYENYAPAETSTDTMIEIAEQVFSEKIKKMQKQIKNLEEFKTLSQIKIENTAERLRRIETTIDKLQISILDKIGGYGQNLNSIKKEMSMMQDSFGKVVNQAVQGHKDSHPVKKTQVKKLVLKRNN